MLEGLRGQREALQPQLEGLEQDVGRLKEWASGLTEKQAQLQTSLNALREAVGQIEERTLAITNDFASKVRQIFVTDMELFKMLSGKREGNHCEVVILLDFDSATCDSRCSNKTGIKKLLLLLMNISITN